MRQENPWVALERTSRKMLISFKMFIIIIFLSLMILYSNKLMLSYCTKRKVYFNPLRKVRRSKMVMVN